MNAQTEKPQEKQAQRVSYLTPPANILETEDGYVLEAEMPGVAKEGLEVIVENGQLHLIGRRAPLEARGRELVRESTRLDFRRTFDLGPSIDTQRISAKIEQGLLLLQLPKAESVKPRKIDIL